MVGSGPAFAQKKPTEIIMLDTLSQLCSLRQREILNFNKLAIEETNNYKKSKDEASKSRSLLVIKNAREAAADAEISWQRLSCFEHLYRPSRQEGR